MLGEAAATRRRTPERYLRLLRSGDRARLGAASRGRGTTKGRVLSVKLSALHPRYRAANARRVMGELYPRRKRLAAIARELDVGITIDAGGSRAARSFARSPRRRSAPRPRHSRAGTASASPSRPMGSAPTSMLGWIDRTRARHQAANHACAWSRAPIGTARSSARRVEGLARLRRLHPQDPQRSSRYIAAPGSCSTRRTRSFRNSPPTTRLPWRRSMRWRKIAARPVRVPAPARHGRAAVQPDRRQGRRRLARAVSTRRSARTRTLLAYLVRRLLENGANTSFVNRIADASVSVDELIEDPVEAGQGARSRRRAAPKDRAAARSLCARARQFGRPRPQQRSAARRALAERWSKASKQRLARGGARRGRGDSQPG